MPTPVDLHNHLLPGVDDGARDETEGLAGLRALHAAGVRSLVTTPHVDASVLARPQTLRARLGELDLAWQRLSRVAATVPDVELRRGAEIMLDLPVLNVDDARVRLAGGPYVLVEFPQPNVPPNTPAALHRIREAGAIPVVAHPERYEDVKREPRFTRRWRDAGAYLQLNGGSLLGWYGKQARSAALALLREGAIDYVASDYHARGRCPLAEYIEVLTALGGEEYASLLVAENPGRVIRGEPLLAVAPLPVRSPLWRRVLALLR
jgi:protein-tyrosine phosphatase